MAIRVLLADDHQLLRQGMRSMLANNARFKVVGEAENGRSAVELSLQLVPDVVVMDISMPDLNGIDATRRIKQKCPGIQVLALSAHADRRFVAQMLAAGASGYLLKDCACDELCRAVSAVAKKQVYLSPAVTGDMVDVYLGRSAQSAGGGPGPLTSRQREVLQLVAEGLNTKRIAARLHVSVKTIETHRAQIMQKLDCQSVAELTKHAIRQGITSL
jgi:DNA-binding NarL/FixJ family response regulator